MKQGPFPSLYILDFDGTLADTGDQINVPGAVALFPHVTETLQRLRTRGARIAIAGSRPRHTIDVFLHELELDSLVDVVLGSEDPPNAKPDPAPALEVLRCLGADASSAAVVGDTADDMEMGRRAGCRTIGVTYGCGTRSALIAAGADALVGDFGALPHVRPALCAQLREAIPERRFAHTLGVTEEALRLAERFGVDADAAWLAGALHDCAKGIPVARQVATCDELGVPLDADLRRCPQVIHGFLGAHLARTLYGVDDPAVLRAIELHTVGDVGMSVLERIVFLADEIEPGRDYPGVEAIREAAKTDLDEALRLFLAGQFRHLADHRVPMHPGLLRLWNDLVGPRRE